MKKRNILLSVSLLVVVLLGVFYHTTLSDQWHVLDSGMGWLWGNSGTKYTLTNESVAGSYSVELNLADLESNHGKKIFEKGRNQSIVVESIEKDSESNDLFITLYSRGPYSVFSGELVTFYAHKPNRQRPVETANAVVHYMGNDYSCTSLGGLKLMRHEGDLCTYQVVLPDIDDGTEHSNIAVLTISGLTENKWTRNWGYRD